MTTSAQAMSHEYPHQRTFNLNDAESRKYLLALTIAVVGVVYGDIGTSPLYAMRECFHGEHAITATQENVLGVLSLMVWSLIMMVTIKYMVFVMRADNRGEGGILALMALTLREAVNRPKLRNTIIILSLCGTALFYGDCMITPAISVLSAVEGLSLASPIFNEYVIPLTLVILVGLFVLQSMGTAVVGAWFGPIMCVWFSVLGILGIISTIQTPVVLLAFNPEYAWFFLINNGWEAFIVLGSVVLVITGGEPLYADMGHFGRFPIRLAWFTFVLPSIALNYFGQAALILREPEAVVNPFYHLVPEWGLYPLVILATAATIIASQAVISGVFSITRQAIQMGYSPRLDVRHTSEKEIGQIYIPASNWLLMVCVIGLVLGFRSSSNLAAAYGIAVTGTMVITSILAFFMLRKLWGWHWSVGFAIGTCFLIMDLAFFTSNLMKIPQGGWFPLLMGMVSFTFLATWRWGRELLQERMHSDMLPMEFLIEMIKVSPPLRVPGTAIFMTSDQVGVPPSLLHNLKHNKVLHERVVFLTVVSEDVPFLTDEKRIEVKPISDNFYRLIVRFGFKEDTNLPQIMEIAPKYGLDFNMMETTFFLGRETLLPSAKHMKDVVLWRKILFISMMRNSRNPADYFKIPPGRVIEIGTQISL